MNILFSQGNEEIPSIWTQFHIQTIQYAVRLRIELISFLEKYKNTEINKDSMENVCRDLEQIFWFWIDLEYTLLIIKKMENQFEVCNEEEIDEKITGVYRIFSHKMRQIEKLITPQLLLKHVAEVGAKNIDIHINTIRLLWLLSKKQKIQESFKK